MKIVSRALDKVSRIWSSRYWTREQPDLQVANRTRMGGLPIDGITDRIHASELNQPISQVGRAAAAYNSLSRGLRISIVPLMVIAAPLAAPAWGVERIIRKWRRSEFEFGVFSATPYFAVVTLISTAILIAFRSIAPQVIALYLLFDLELVCLVTCATIAVINPGRTQSILRTVSRRKKTFHPQVMTANRHTIYAAVVSALYSTWFFGAVSFALWQTNYTYFSGVSQPSSRIYIFWQFMQHSFSTITNSSNPLNPRRFLSQLISDFELLIGIFLLVFLFSVLASTWTERSLQRAEPTQPGHDNSQDEI